MSAGPWSVKGIDPRARARAKTAARRQGLTLGEWLNKVILDDGPGGNPDWDAALEAFPGFTGSEGLSPEDDRLLRAMVGRLSERVDEGEQSSARALDGMEASVRALAEKVTAIEKQRETALEETRAIVARMREGQDALDRRVGRLEKDGAEGGGLAPETARAVETAMGKLARRLYRSENETGNRLEQAEENAERARRTAESLDERLARIEKRGEEIEDLSKRRDRRSSAAFGSLHKAADGLSRRVEAAEQLAHDSARAFDGAIGRIEDRIRSIELRNDGAEFELRFDRLSEDVARTIADTRRQLAGAVEQAASEPRVDRLEHALGAALDRIDAAERRHADSLTRIGEEITRFASAVDTRITESEKRITEAAESRQAERALDARFDEVRRENKSAVKQMGEQIARLGKSLSDRVAQAEARSAEAVEDAAGRMAAMVERIEQTNASEAELEDRLRQSEERTAERIETAMDGVRARLDQARAETADALTPVERTMTALAERLEAIETRASKAEEDKKTRQEAKASDPLLQPLQTPPEARAAQVGPATLEAPAAPAPGEDPFAGFAEAGPAPAKPQAQAQAQPGQARPPQPRPRPAAQPAPAQPAGERAYAPNAKRPLGATADSDFLAAARQRQRPSQGFEYDLDQEGSGRGRAVLVGLSVVGFLAVGAAAVMLVLNSGGQPVPATTAGTAPVEALFSRPVESAGESGATAPATLAPTLADESETAPADAAATASSLPSPLPQGSDPATAEAELAASAPDLPQAQPVRTTTPQPVDPQPVAPRMTLQSAAADGDPVARYLLGMQALENGQTETAVALLRRAAEQDIPAAQYRYGKMLETGEGVTENLEAARRWTERAAEAGHRRAMHNLGVMFAYGVGAPADYERAAGWFERAARLGLSDGQFNLAMLYLRGQGVPESPADAYAWFLIAAETAGDQDAARRAAEIARDLPPEAVTEARAVAQGFSPLPLDEAANGVYRDLPWEAGSDAVLIREVQAALNALGYDAGPADGVMGARTRGAVMAFEQDQGLPRTGRVDAVLGDRLSRAVNG